MLAKTEPVFPSLAICPSDMYPGLSIRDWFAGQAMAGVCQNLSAFYESGPCNDAIAERAYLIADRMISARERSL